MKKHFIWMTALALSVCTFMGSTTSAAASEVDEIRIEDGVYIGTVNVSGMTEDEAYAAISDYVDSLMTTTFTLNGVDGKSMEVTAEDMGISCDPTDSVKIAMDIAHKGNLIDRYKDLQNLKEEERVLPLMLEVDKQKTANLIYKRHKRLSRAAINASLKKDGKKFTFVAGTDGEEIDEVNSVFEINHFLQFDFDGSNTEINLATQVAKSRGTEEELAMVTDVLGRFKTNFSSSAEGRRINVTRATELVNGAIIYPGEEYSVHTAISPINEDNGYAIGHAYVSGQVVDSVGGGVCQVATTVYNAVIRAELEITQRYNHSMVVGYVDDSADSTLSGDSKDLRFVNNTEYPVYIEAYVESGWVNMVVYGHETRPADREVSFESEILEQGEKHYEYKWTDDDIGYYQTMQTAHPKVKARLWKIVKEGGKEISREIFNNSTYKEGKAIVHIGKKGATAEQLQILKSAIATGDDEQVRAAIYKVRAITKANKKKNEQTSADETAQDAQ